LLLEDREADAERAVAELQRGGFDPTWTRVSTLRALREQRRRDEAALRESEERTRLILANALDAVITIDTAGLILSWNPQAEHLLGWREDEVLNAPLSETIIPPAYRLAHERGLERFRTTGEGAVLNRPLELNTSVEMERHS
jgi:PAS domain-containing protein